MHTARGVLAVRANWAHEEAAQSTTICLSVNAYALCNMHCTALGIAHKI